MRKRKNFFPTLLLGVFFWLLFAFLVLFIPPETFGAVPAFFILLFLAILFPTALIFANTRRGFLLASGVIAFLLLRLLGVGNILSVALLLGIILAVEYYLSG